MIPSNTKRQLPKTFSAFKLSSLSPFLILSASFLFCFKDWLPRFTSEIFLSLDSTVLYYPIYTWVHQHLIQDKLPLICDLAYHGAPVAAVSMAGVLSPVLWIFHLISSPVPMINLIFLAPFGIFIWGCYCLGRQLGLSASACLLLDFLWTYNGQRMAQLDHWNVAWACAFFPWAFWALLRYCSGRPFFWLMLSGLFWGLNLLSGHPQIFFLEGLFFLFWALFSPGPLSLAPRLLSLTGMTFIACLVASPLILFTGENLFSGGFHFQWGETDRFFHSWTPLNFLTLVFPWFFGRDQFDRAGSTYWWQYQFVEMQVALSIAGLFFIILFFFYKNSQRRWIGLTALFGLAMALGKFFFLYSWVQSLPVFSWFRDPARYWHLVTWATGLGAAYAWDEWFSGEPLLRKGRKLALGLASFAFLLILTGWFILTFGRPLLESAAAWLTRHFLLGDSLHTQPLSAYLARLPEKLNAFSASLDFRNSAVLIPLLLFGMLLVTVWNRKNWNLDFQKGLLLALVFADLMIFRMPLGNVFYKPSDIPAPAYAAPQNRSLVMLYKNTSPLPPEYGEMAYPNMNLVSGRPNLVIDANPALPGYDNVLKELGWFSWVYKDRDPVGFSKNIDLLQELGIDQIVSDSPFSLPKPFKTIQDHYPYVYSLSDIFPKACVAAQHMKTLAIDVKNVKSKINTWDETSLSVTAKAGETRLKDNNGADYLVQPDLLLLQKTYLPGWKAAINGMPTKVDRDSKVLISLSLRPGENHVTLRYEPLSLRFGFFLFFLFFGVFTFASLRLRTA